VIASRGPRCTPRGRRCSGRAGWGSRGTRVRPTASSVCLRESQNNSEERRDSSSAPKLRELRRLLGVCSATTRYHRPVFVLAPTTVRRRVPEREVAATSASRPRRSPSPVPRSARGRVRPGCRRRGRQHVLWIAAVPVDQPPGPPEDPGGVHPADSRPRVRFVDDQFALRVERGQR